VDERKRIGQFVENWFKMSGDTTMQMPRMGKRMQIVDHNSYNLEFCSKLLCSNPRWN